MIGPKHTPDPWAVVVTDKGFYNIVADGLVVARLDTREPYVADAAADAQLIAAAPRLAEALKQLLDYTLACELIVYNVEEQRNEHPVVAAARAALREAGVS